MEPVLPLSIVLGIVGGAASGFLTLGRKFTDVDHRIDTIELRLAKEYVDKDDLARMIERLDDRMDRVDYKLDRILIGYDKNVQNFQ